MKFHEGPAIIALLLGMMLAFILNYAEQPIWLSLLAGIGTGLVLYILIYKIKGMGEDQ